MTSPMLSINAALLLSVEYIDKSKVPVAIFVIDGHVKAARSNGKLYARRVESMSTNLVGVYSPRVDARHVREDLVEFFKGRAV